MNTKNTFLYFAYGSNLLQKRIQLQNPSATRHNIGFLKDYKLEFFGFSQRWGGASATIIPQPGHRVWGAIWEIDVANLPDLDDQEGVADNIYFPKTVDVEIPDGQLLECRVYERAVSSALVGSHEMLPFDKPSLLYKETILHGAVESKLPESYMEMLRNIPHNGYKGQAEMGHMLNVL